MDLNFCSICKGVPGQRLVTECKHVFCKQCLLPWLSKSTTCPYCNKELHRSCFGTEVDDRSEPLAEKLKLTVGAFDEERHHQFLYFDVGRPLRQIMVVNASNMRPQVEFSNRSEFNAVFAINQSLVTVLTPLFGRPNELNVNRIYGKSSVTIRGEHYPMFEDIDIHIEKSCLRLSTYDPHVKLLTNGTRWSRAFVARMNAFKEHITSLKEETKEKDQKSVIKNLNEANVSQEEGNKVKSV